MAKQNVFTTHDLVVFAQSKGYKGNKAIDLLHNIYPEIEGTPNKYKLSEIQDEEWQEDYGWKQELVNIVVEFMKNNSVSSMMIVNS